MSRNHVTDACTGPAHKAGSPPQCCPQHQSLSTCWLMECIVLLHVPSLLFFLNVTIMYDSAFFLESGV